MQNKICLGILLNAAFLSSITNAQEEAEIELFFNLENRSYTEPTSIDSFSHEFNGSLDYGEYAYIYNKAEIGAKYKNYTLSFVDRYDNFQSFSNDMARFYFETENGLDQPDNRLYDLQLDARYLRSNGVKLSYNWQVADGFSINVGASFLQGREFYDGSLRGQLTALPSDSYDGLVNLNLTSYKDLILDIPVPNNPKGKGYAIDINANWKINDQWLLSFEVRDAYSDLDWNSRLDSVFNATTATRNFDTTGKLITTPTLSGTQQIETIKQTLPEKFISQLNYQVNDKHAVQAEVFHTEFFTETTLAYQYTVKTNQSVNIFWGVDTQVLGIEYQTKYARFKLGSDSFDYEKAHALRLELELKYAY